MNVDLSPRDALAQSILRTREVYKIDGVYTDEIRLSLQEVVEMNKQLYPHLFGKGLK